VYTTQAITSSGLASIARKIYTGGPLLTRVLQHWRPYVCPFDKVIEEIPPGSYVLDIGCGGGLLLGAAARIGRISGGVGFDFSMDAINVANAMTETLGPDHHLQFLHLSALDAWPQGTFTLVSMIDVMHHVPPNAQRDVFRKAANSVQPGARMLYKDIAPRPRWRAAANTVHDLLLARQWVHYVPMTTIVAWAKEEGLNLVREYRLNRLWYGHQFAVFVRPNN
jgi:2-polyprenyl-3-methyl-5-hydroxy-6-metoxy-1,4-benzoquinol methylase